MARPVTLAELRNRARTLADLPLSDFATDPYVNLLINSHLTRQWDLLVDTAGDEYYADNVTIVTLPNIVPYALPGEFYKLVNVFALDSGTPGRMRPVRPMTGFDIGDFKAPVGSYTVQVEFVPCAPRLTADAQTFDGVNGWDELIVSLVARDLRIKERSESQDLQIKCAEMRSEIMSHKIRDIGHSVPLTDVYQSYAQYYYNSNRICGYRLRGGNIELYELDLYYP